MEFGDSVLTSCSFADADAGQLGIGEASSAYDNCMVQPPRFQLGFLHTTMFTTFNFCRDGTSLPELFVREFGMDGWCSGMAADRE